MTEVRLIHGSALHIPVGDESVQTCVTSPPYWGLRSYAGEQREVWGGDPGCAHEWGAARIVTVGRNDTDPETLARRAATYGTGAGSGNIPPKTTAAGDSWCACGAWYGALGLEPTPDLYVEHMVEIFREVRRVLRKDGTLWLNLGDSYAAQRGGTHMPAETIAGGTGGVARDGGRVNRDRHDGYNPSRNASAIGLKHKDLVGIPWMVAFALRADGWYLRSDIIWHKPNPMPESVTDRPTKSHEYVFLLSKSASYFYDADAIREPHALPVWSHKATGAGHGVDNGDRNDSEKTRMGGHESGRNKRTVWTIPTRPYPGAHFATYPEQLVEPCILAGTSPKACGVCGAPWERLTEREDQGWDGSRYGERAVSATGGAKDGGTARSTLGSSNGRLTGKSLTTGWRSTCEHEDDSGACVVLDPFNGSGTTGRVAVRHGRSYVGVDISKEYLDEQAVRRIYGVQMEAAL